MSTDSYTDQAFIRKLSDLVLKNLKNENFNVKELAREAGMSRSTLNRRLRYITRKSVSQFIREIRLHRAHEMLHEKLVSVSEVSYAVGFSSPAYFSACFREFFGYPPGKVDKDGPCKLSEEAFTELPASGIRERSRKELTDFYRVRIIAFCLLASGVALYLILKNSGASSVDDLRSANGRISIAVMPFDNLTGNMAWESMQISLISYLSNFDELTVREKESVDMLLESNGITNLASLTPKLAGLIAGKLEAKIYITGMVSKAGNRVRISVQLVNTRSGSVIKSFQLEDDSGEERIFPMIDSVSLGIKNFLVTAKMLVETDPDLRPYCYSSSPVAFEYFTRADEARKKHDARTSLQLYYKAVEADSGFIPAIVFLSMCHIDLGEFAAARNWCLKAYSMKDHAHLKDRYMIEWYHAYLFGAPEEEISSLEKYTGVDDNVPVSYWQIGNAYGKLLRFADAIPWYEKTLEIYKKWNVRPMFIYNYLSLIKAYHQTGQHRKERKLIAVAERTFPEDSWMLWCSRAVHAFSQGDTVNGKLHVEQYRSEMKARSMSETEILTKIATLYTESGKVEKAEKYLREAYSRKADDPSIVNYLSYLLIDNELNIKEGLDLAKEGLKKYPDNYYLLRTYGWGLAKSGIYREALEMLRKSWEIRPIYDDSHFKQIGEVERLVSKLN